MYSSTYSLTSALDEEWVVNPTSRSLYLRERIGVHCIGGWVGPSARLVGCGKTHSHRDSIPGPSSPWRVAIPTDLSGPTFLLMWLRNFF